MMAVVLGAPSRGACATFAATNEVGANEEKTDELVITVQPGEYTIEQALQQSRLSRLHGESQSTVLQLQPGTYRLSQPVIIRPEDNHTRIIAQGEVIVSGGVKIEGWRKEGRLWVADVPLWNGRPLEFRQLWVNGHKAVRARDVKDFEQMYRIRSVDKAKETIYVPAEAVTLFLGQGLKGQGARSRGQENSSTNGNSTFKFQTSNLKSQTSNLEMVLHEMWCIANLRVKDIRVQGDSAAVTFHNPESHIHFMHPWPSPMVTPDGKHNSAFYLTGARVLLDEPGEWYLDSRAGRLYYMPREGEDMRTADVEAPALETLLQVAGTPDQPVEDVSIEGVTFRYATWMRPSIMGHAPLQAGMYMTEAFKIRPQIKRPNGDHGLDNQGWVGRPAAAIEVNCATGMTMTRCTVERCASTGIDYHLYIKGGAISDCTLRDLGGTGILAGSFGPESHEAHLPYMPADMREICTGLTIAKNVITDVTNEDWGCVGIGAGFVRDIKILDNEISEVSYTGISLGWGWNQQPCSMANNLVRGNLIHHYARHMYDTAGIYTLGAQPHTLIEENTIRDIYHPGYVHDPEHWFYLYTDEGSSGITVRNNWTPTEKYLKNSNGPGNTWENNGPIENSKTHPQTPPL